MRRRLNLDLMPYPIAAAYRGVRACHGEDARRLKHVLQTAEMAARYLAVVVLCDLRARAQEASGELELPPALRSVLPQLRRPSFGHWIAILREGTKVLAGAGDDGENLSFVPELAEVLLTAKGAPGPPLKLLDGLVTTRNHFAHGDMSAGAIQRACGECQEKVDELLGGLDFLGDYSPYFVRQVSVRKRRLEPSQYKHQFWLLQGPYQDPDALAENREWHTDTDEMILARPDGKYLHLDPLLVYLDPEQYDDSSGLRSDLYVLNGFEKRGQRLIMHYLPAGPSGRAFKTNDKTPDGADPAMDPRDQDLLAQGLRELLDLAQEPEASDSS